MSELEEVWTTVGNMTNQAHDAAISQLQHQALQQYRGGFRDGFAREVDASAISEHRYKARAIKVYITMESRGPLAQVKVGTEINR